MRSAAALAGPAAARCRRARRATVRGGVATASCITGFSAGRGGALTTGVAIAGPGVTIGCASAGAWRCASALASAARTRASIESDLVGSGFVSSLASAASRGFASGLAAAGLGSGLTCSVLGCSIFTTLRAGSAGAVFTVARSGGSAGAPLSRRENCRPVARAGRGEACGMACSLGMNGNGRGRQVRRAGVRRGL